MGRWGWGVRGELIPLQESLCKMQTQEKAKVAWVFPPCQQGPEGLWHGPPRLEEEGRNPERPLKGFVGEEGPLGLIP